MLSHSPAILQNHSQSSLLSKRDSIEKLSSLSSLGPRVYDAARQHAMESRTKAARELEAESDKLRVAKRARLEDSRLEEGTPMDTDSSSARLGGNRLIKRKELIVLMEQALANLGFREVSEQLAGESGIQYETQTVAAFRKAILEGHFGEALRLLDQLGLGERGAAKQARFLILEQKFLEVGDCWCRVKEKPGRVDPSPVEHLIPVTCIYRAGISNKYSVSAVLCFFTSIGLAIPRWHEHAWTGAEPQWWQRQRSFASAATRLGGPQHPAGEAAHLGGLHAVHDAGVPPKTR